jgi:hypothetical protein
MNRKEGKHQSWETAITFAEAGEWEMARSFMPSARQGKLVAWFEKISMAITFAEHGLHEEAVRIAASGHSVSARRRNFFELCALDNVPCTFATLSPIKLSVG